MSKLWRRAVQNIIIFLIRPYVIRELPGWGRLASLVDYRWDWLWLDAPLKTIREKMYGNLMRLDLSKWSDRSDYFLGRWYDLEIQLIVASLVKSGETVVDVGAHRGEFALAACRVVGLGGKVICFEPNPQSVRFLEDEIKLNQICNVVVHACGLADQNDILTLTVNQGIGHFGTEPYKEGNFMFSAPVHAGDELLAHEKLALIKIDVEGFETKVIHGLVKTMQRCAPVVITEINANLLKGARSSVEDLKRAMENLGYKGFRLALRRRGWRYDWCLAEFDQKGAFDAVWLNTNVAEHRLISERRFYGNFQQEAVIFETPTT